MDFIIFMKAFFPYMYAILWILFCAAEWYHLENPFYKRVI